MAETAKKRPDTLPQPSRDELREQVARHVAEDAEDRPEEYLRDSEVREGGE